MSIRHNLSAALGVKKGLTRVSGSKRPAWQTTIKGQSVTISVKDDHLDIRVDETGADYSYPAPWGMTAQRAKTWIDECMVRASLSIAA